MQSNQESGNGWAPFPTAPGGMAAQPMGMAMPAAGAATATSDTDNLQLPRGARLPFPGGLI